jgi:hypothetical protein
MSRSPHAAPALSDDDAAPVRELSHRGIHSGGGLSFSTEQFFIIGGTIIPELSGKKKYSKKSHKNAGI